MSAILSYLRLVTFTCQFFNHKREIIVSLTESCDILCLQEFLLNGNNNIKADHVSASRTRVWVTNFGTDTNFVKKIVPVEKVNSSNTWCGQCAHIFKR